MNDNKNVLRKLEELLREIVGPRQMNGDYRFSDLRREGDELVITVMIDGEPHSVSIFPQPPPHS